MKPAPKLRKKAPKITKRPRVQDNIKGGLKPPPQRGLYG